MPIYSSDQNVKSGLPLGGLGAGKLEIMPSGVLDHFTFLNNVHGPLRSADSKNPSGILGFNFFIWTKDRNKRVTKLLSTQNIGDCAGVESIRFNGSFPFAHLDYEDRDLPVAVSLEAFAPFIPKDEKNSGLPVAYFKFKITNPLARPVSVSLMAAARNLVGEWAVGRFNQAIDTHDSLSLRFYNKKVQPQDRFLGEMCLSVIKNNKSVSSYMGEWNMQARPFVFDKASLTFGEAHSAFVQDGLLPDVNTEKVVSAESFQLGGALASKIDLKPKSHATVVFALSWFFPGYAEGRMYEAWFRNVSEVARYAVVHHDDLYAKTKAWVKSLSELPIEPWLKDALLNNLYPLVSGSLWTKRQRFGIFEAPEVCPLLGTLDVRFYGSLALALFFPRLELKEMMQFAEAQKPQGYIPHDLGFRRSDLSSLSTNGFLWKDLNSKFILLVYRDFLMTKDDGFLKKMYPFVKKAFYWLAATDHNKDFLPDHEGADQTFDLWNFYGANSYTGGIFLASLLALERIALLLQDEDMAQEASLWFKKGRTSFEKKLWHKRYFLAYNSARERLSEHQLAHHVKSQKVSVSCMAAQLTGQWIAHSLGLGYIVSEEKVRRALTTIFEWNCQASMFGAVNGVFAQGEKDKSNPHAENVWYGVTYSVAALAVYEGLEKEGLALARKAWDNAAVHALNPWNQPDAFSSSDGSAIFGDHCMRNMVVWSLLFALAKKDKKIAKFLETFAS